MSVYTWNVLKKDKSFNVLIYRRGLSILVVSLILSFILALFIFHVYLEMPERDYYATSGITPPVKLKAMLTPNMSSVPLLEQDSTTTHDGSRVIPG